MDAVAARAKVSKATIYRRWDSKASLVVDAMRFCNFAELELPQTLDLRADLHRPGCSVPCGGGRTGRRRSTTAS